MNNNATNHTQYFGFPLFASGDKPSWLTDWNGTVEELDRILEANRLQIQANTQGMESFNQQVTLIREAIAGINARIDGDETTIEELLTDVANLRDLLVQTDTTVKSLLPRMVTAENNISTITTNLATLSETVSSNYSELDNRLTAQAGSIANLSSQTSSLATRMGTAEQNITRGKSFSDLASLELAITCDREFQSNWYYRVGDTIGFRLSNDDPYETYTCIEEHVSANTFEGDQHAWRKILAPGYPDSDRNGSGVQTITEKWHRTQDVQAEVDKLVSGLYDDMATHWNLSTGGNTVNYHEGDIVFVPDMSDDGYEGKTVTYSVGMKYDATEHDFVDDRRTIHLPWLAECVQDHTYDGSNADRQAKVPRWDQSTQYWSPITDYTAIMRLYEYYHIKEQVDPVKEDVSSLETQVDTVKNHLFEPHTVDKVTTDMQHPTSMGGGFQKLRISPILQGRVREKSYARVLTFRMTVEFTSESDANAFLNRIKNDGDGITEVSLFDSSYTPCFTDFPIFFDGYVSGPTQGVYTVYASFKVSFPYAIFYEYDGEGKAYFRVYVTATYPDQASANTLKLGCVLNADPVS